MRWSATGPSGKQSASRPCAVKLAPPASARDAGTLWVTPLYRLKTASHRVAEVLSALSEGLDVSAAAPVFGHRQATITTWLARARAHSTTLHDRTFRALRLPHVQVAEIRTRLRSRAHGLWLWLAVDPVLPLSMVDNSAPRVVTA